MGKYRPIDILRKFVLRQCIEHLIVTSQDAVWLNLTFWENVTNKAYASKCWDKLSKTLRRENPDFRLVGIWARQGRGAWHIHAVCNQRFDLQWLQSKAMRCGFGPQFHVQQVDRKPETPEKLARYISGYCTDKNGLDAETDKGVRRMIFVGPNVRIVDMRYRSGLKKVTAVGKRLVDGFTADQLSGMTEWEKDFSTPEGRKKAWETWGAWYKRNREYWFRVGWESLSLEERRELYEMDECILRYFETGRWAYL